MVKKTGKTTFSVRIDEDLLQQLKQFVLSKYGKLYEVLGVEVQNAIAHWIGEQGLISHTNSHKINPGIPRVQGKIDGIIAWLRDAGYSNQFSMNSWKQACIHTVGSDQRTVDKYLHLAKNLGRVKHYAGAIWEIV